MSDEKDPRALAARKTDDQIKAIHERLYQGDLRMKKIEDAQVSITVELAENTAITRRIESSMAGIVAFSDDLASGARIICRLAKGINFLANKKIWVPVLVCYLAIYFVTHDGQLPDWAYRLVSGLIGT